jgi:hypothetical protein
MEAPLPTTPKTVSMPRNAVYVKFDATTRRAHIILQDMVTWALAHVQFPGRVDGWSPDDVRHMTMVSRSIVNKCATKGVAAAQPGLDPCCDADERFVVGVRDFDRLMDGELGEAANAMLPSRFAQAFAARIRTLSQSPLRRRVLALATDLERVEHGDARDEIQRHTADTIDAFVRERCVRGSSGCLADTLYRAFIAWASTAVAPADKTTTVAGRGTLLQRDFWRAISAYGAHAVEMTDKVHIVTDIALSHGRLNTLSHAPLLRPRPRSSSLSGVAFTSSVQTSLVKDKTALSSSRPSLRGSCPTSNGPESPSATDDVNSNERTRRTAVLPSPPPTLSRQGRKDQASNVILEPEQHKKPPETQVKADRFDSIPAESINAEYPDSPTMMTPQRALSSESNHRVGSPRLSPAHSLHNVRHDPAGHVAAIDLLYQATGLWGASHGKPTVHRILNILRHRGWTFEKRRIGTGRATPLLRAADIDGFLAASAEIAPIGDVAISIASYPDTDDYTRLMNLLGHERDPLGRRAAAVHARDSIAIHAAAESQHRGVCLTLDRADDDDDDSDDDDDHTNDDHTDSDSDRADGERVRKSLQPTPRMPYDCALSGDHRRVDTDTPALRQGSDVRPDAIRRPAPRVDGAATALDRLLTTTIDLPRGTKRLREPSTVARRTRRRRGSTATNTASDPRRSSDRDRDDGDGDDGSDTAIDTGDKAKGQRARQMTPKTSRKVYDRDGSNADRHLKHRAKESTPDTVPEIVIPPQAVRPDERPVSAVETTASTVASDTVVESLLDEPQHNGALVDALAERAGPGLAFCIWRHARGLWHLVLAARPGVNRHRPWRVLADHRAPDGNVEMAAAGIQWIEWSKVRSVAIDLLADDPQAVLSVDADCEPPGNDPSTGAISVSGTWLFEACRAWLSGHPRPSPAIVPRLALRVAKVAEADPEGPHAAKAIYLARACMDRLRQRLTAGDS